ncbi:MAG: guanylate kinase [Lepagella sp.]
MSKKAVIVLSGPSGTGKSTIIRRILEMPDLNLAFSISATSRPPRGEEQNGREYHFLSPEEFDRRIAEGDFVEWEEVYSGTKYGTLRSEVDKQLEAGHNVIMDVDVKGAFNVKDTYEDDCLIMFILPPDMETLEQRLRDRNTDSEESLRKRLEKARFEMDFAPKFDRCVVNKDIDEAVAKVAAIIRGFLVWYE